MGEVVRTGEDRSRGGREARRRRIADRGAERLAFITGHIKSLPSNSSETPAAADVAPREDVIIPNHESDENQVVHETLSKGRNVTVEASNSGKESPEIELSTQENHSEESSLETSLATDKICCSIAGSEKQSLGISLPTQSFVQAQPHKTSHKTSQITREIYSAITASENTRLWCSLSVATFMIMSHMQIPILGQRTSVFGLPPVYFLLITNISIFIAKLILGAQDLKLLRAGQGITSPLNGFSTVDFVGKVVEILMIIQHVIGVLFVDFVVYAVALVCGLSLLRTIDC